MTSTKTSWRGVDRLVVGCDLGATVFFAVEAAILSIDAELDLFGVLTVAFAASLGGGILRDIVVGGTPPLALRFKRYPLLAFAGGRPSLSLRPRAARCARLDLGDARRRGALAFRCIRRPAGPGFQTELGQRGRCSAC